MTALHLDRRPCNQTAMRKCLKCTQVFPSSGFGHRICDPCDGTESVEIVGGDEAAFTINLDNLLPTYA